MPRNPTSVFRCGTFSARSIMSIWGQVTLPSRQMKNNRQEYLLCYMHTSMRFSLLGETDLVCGFPTLPKTKLVDRKVQCGCRISKSGRLLPKEWHSNKTRWKTVQHLGALIPNVNQLPTRKPQFSWSVCGPLENKRCVQSARGLWRMELISNPTVA